MDTKKTTIQLIKDLFASEGGLLPYTLYKRYGVTPIELVHIVKKLQMKGLVQVVDSNRLMLTREGRSNAESYIISLRREKKIRAESSYFRSIMANKLDKKMPFMPSNLFFEQYIVRKEGEMND